MTSKRCKNVIHGMEICWERLFAFNMIIISPIKTYNISIMTNSNKVRNVVLQPSCESQMKHNHPFVWFSGKQRSQQHHSAEKKLM